MPGTGRPEQPLVRNGSVSQLADELRRLRHSAGLTYTQLAAESGYPSSTLRAAALGRRRPSWKVIRAFVSACGGDQEVAWALWAAARPGRSLLPGHRQTHRTPRMRQAQLTLSACSSSSGSGRKAPWLSSTGSRTGTTSCLRPPSATCCAASNCPPGPHARLRPGLRAGPRPGQ